MAGEKNFETRLKKWLESEGIYPLGEPVDRMGTPPCGYWEKRWGGGRYVKSGLPDMKIVVKGITLEVELKDTNGTPSELQKRNLAQINNSGCFGFILYPEGFETFKKIVKGVKQCEFPTAGLISLINAHTDTAMGYAKERIKADCAEPKSIDELREAGLHRIRAARKGKDSVNNGIQYIQGYTIIIHPRCVNFITEISNYTWDEDKFGTKINIPIDDFNHLMDAMRYALEDMLVGSAFSFE